MSKEYCVMFIKKPRRIRQQINLSLNKKDWYQHTINLKNVFKMPI